MEDLPDVFERFATRLETLERRVDALEHPGTARVETAMPEPSPAAAQITGGTLSDSDSVTSGAFPVLGKAMLGIAGAYLLRAVAESSSLPKPVVAAVAIAYALAWLVWASRAKAGDWLAGTIYACTSALILAPMLWELTLRFEVLSAPVTAAVVGGFVIAASALAWKRDFAPVLWVANATAIAIALALGIATHQLVPFIAVLLAMMAIGEYAAARGRESGVHVLVALAADVSIWALIYIYASPESTRTDYPPLGMVALIAPGLGLFGILGASLIFKTVLKGKTITVFETIETMIGFLLAACGVIYFGPQASVEVVGVVCLALSVAGYAVVFLHFDRMEKKRNSLVFAGWSAALLLTGCVLSLPAQWQAILLGVAAIAAMFVGARLGRMALELHGAVFLVTAAMIAGLLVEIFNALAGTMPGAPGWDVVVVAACAVACYAVMRPGHGDSKMRQGLALVIVVVAIGAVVALAVQGLVELTSMKVIPGAHHLAFIRTFTVCVAAIALAFGGAHWRRLELTRIGYAALGLLALKLVVEDLRHGHLAFIAGSIFLFAITLIVVPRVARMGQRV